MEFNSEIYNKFIKGIDKVFEQSVNSNLSRMGKLQRVEGDIRNPDDVLGILTFTCPDYIGAILISFPESTVLNIYRRLVYEDADQLSANVVDSMNGFLGLIIDQIMKIFTDEDIVFDEAVILNRQRVKFKNDDDLEWLHYPLEAENVGKLGVFIGLGQVTFDV
ncbi:hypothetical protein AAEX28_02530 [Lentisphaerota bacterium WC36G]|nr:hypothetical protein LJT99_05415 [Lentisphaerae bacterium WC36]